MRVMRMTENSESAMNLEPNDSAFLFLVPNSCVLIICQCLMSAGDALNLSTIKYIY